MMFEPFKREKTNPALVEFRVHLAAHMVNIVVDHRKSDADGENGNGREADGCVADEAVRLNLRVDVHG